MPKLKIKYLLLAAATTLWLSASGAPNIAEALKQTPASPSQKAPGVDFTLPKAVQPTVASSESHGFFVSRIHVEGADALSADQISSITSQATGRNTTLGELNNVCTKITDLYRRKGFFLSRAYVPQQEVKDGLVTIKVVEAKLADIKLTNNSGVNDTVILDRLSLAGADLQIAENRIGHALAATAELSGVQISRATVEPGTTTGSTNLLITTTEKARLTGSVYTDNQGALYTGRSRVGLAGTWASPSDRGDSLSINAISTTSAGLISGYLRYDYPVLSRLNVFTQLSQTDYKLGGTYAPLEAHGNAITAEIGCSYTLSQDLTSKLSSAVQVGHRCMDDFIDASMSSNPKNDLFYAVSLDYKLTFTTRNRTASAALNTKITTGKMQFDDSAASFQDSVGANTQGSYTKFEITADYSHPVLAECSLTATLRSQTTANSKNLDGSQKIGVSGAEGLRAFSSSELLGDNGLFAQLSFGFPISTRDGFIINGSIFAEYGRVSGGNANSEVSTRSLSDYGIEVQANRGTWFLSTCAAFGSSQATIAEPSTSCKVTFKASKNF